MLSMTNGRNETLTPPDIANAFLNAPINKDAVMLLSVPNILARLGIFETGAAWQIRRAVHGLKESPRLWQEERDK
eukprot:12916648-Prorocentrum_lima.AAC.1